LKASIAEGRWGTINKQERKISCVGPCVTPARWPTYTERCRPVSRIIGTTTHTHRSILLEFGRSVWHVFFCVVFLRGLRNPMKNPVEETCRILPSSLPEESGALRHILKR
ncbi:unnamed protein product, partial [Sphacelaria rigidula]